MIVGSLGLCSVSTSLSYTAQFWQKPFLEYLSNFLVNGVDVQKGCCSLMLVTKHHHVAIGPIVFIASITILCACTHKHRNILMG